MKRQRVTVLIVGFACIVAAGATAETVAALPARADQIRTPSAQAAVTTAPDSALIVESGSGFERASAAEAMEYVRAAYAEIGAEPILERPCRIIFQDQITVDGEVIDGILGRYDKRNDIVYMLAFESESFQETELEGLPDLATKFRLVIAHEFTHFLNSALPVSPNPILDEVIAGYMQYAWLGAERAESLLAIYDGYAIDTLVNISMLAYRNNPEDFLVAGYRYFTRHPAVLERCLLGNPPPVRDPSLPGNR